MNGRKMMTNERLLELIEAYGAEPGAWPEGERASAEAHLAAHPDWFASALADARGLDAMFEAAPQADVPDGLAARILNGAPTARRARRGLGARLGGLIAPNGIRWPAGAALASLMMGLVAGYATAPAVADDSYQTEEDALVYSALGYDGFESYVSEADG